MGAAVLGLPFLAKLFGMLGASGAAGGSAAGMSALAPQGLAAGAGPGSSAMQMMTPSVMNTGGAAFAPQGMAAGMGPGSSAAQMSTPSVSGQGGGWMDTLKGLGGRQDRQDKADAFFAGANQFAHSFAEPDLTPLNNIPRNGAPIVTPTDLLNPGSVALSALMAKIAGLGG